MSDTSMIPTNGSGNVIPLDTAVTPFAFTPGTDFKAVAIGPSPNLEPLPAYFSDPLLLTGNQPGIAISAFNNRALRQGTFVGSSLCLWISGQISKYIQDDGDQINWQVEWSQALTNFINGVIPPAPNLGNYLPLSGGNMSGYITFNPGISTVLANNTWYFALDTGGQRRGLILKASDNNVYINDGSASYVIFNGYPSVQNNYYFSGRQTGGSVHGMIGILNDNQIHIAASDTAEVYFDNTSSVHMLQTIIPNNRWYYSLDTGGNPRAVCGMSSANEMWFGLSSIGNTQIAAGANSYIYLRSYTAALAVFIVNGYTYMNGGGRAYVPGGNDPFQVYADYGYYARTQYVVGGIRQWNCGVLNNGTWGLSDESAHAFRWQVDLNGNVTVNNTETIGGSLYVNYGAQIVNGLTVYDSINVARGGISVQNSGSNWALYVGGGGFYVNGMYGQPSYVIGGLNVYDGLNVARGDLSVTSGNFWAGGPAYLVTNQGLGTMFSFFNRTSIYPQESWFTINYPQTWAIICRADGYFLIGNESTSNTGRFSIEPAVGYMAFNGTIYGIGPSSGFDYSLALQYGRALKSGNLFWEQVSESRFKSNIEPFKRGLDLVKQMRPVSYNLVREPNAGVFHGFLAEDVEPVMPEMVHTHSMPIPAEVKGVTDMGYDGFEDVKTVDSSPLFYAMLNAIIELAARVEHLEGRT